MIKSIVVFFDKLEDRVRAKLSRYPILYAFIGGVGVVIFWRGIWHTADFITSMLFSYQQTGSLDLGSLPWWDGPLSIVVGSALLLSTGLFVVDFIGSEVIMKKLKGETKLTEKAEEETEIEAKELGGIGKEIKEISKRLEHIEGHIEENSKDKHI